MRSETQIGTGYKDKYDAEKAPQSTMGPLSAQLGRLGERAKLFEDLFGQLAESLAPVLKPEEPRDQAAVVPVDERPLPPNSFSPTTHALRSALDSLEASYERIMELRGRLDLS